MSIKKNINSTLKKLCTLNKLPLLVGNPKDSMTPFKNNNLSSKGRGEVATRHKLLFILVLFFSISLSAQKVPVYKINNLLKRIHNTSDTIYIVNFWATWCKPCVAELPDFEKINREYKTKKVKVLLVSMDFKEDISKKLKPFLQKNKLSCEVVLLDEMNGNDFINQVSPKWGGAIPATLITKKNNSVNEFFEKKLNYNLLVEQINKFK